MESTLQVFTATMLFLTFVSVGISLIPIKIFLPIRIAAVAILVFSASLFYDVLPYLYGRPRIADSTVLIEHEVWVEAIISDKDGVLRDDASPGIYLWVRPASTDDGLARDRSVRDGLKEEQKLSRSWWSFKQSFIDGSNVLEPISYVIPYSSKFEKEMAKAKKEARGKPFRAKIRQKKGGGDDTGQFKDQKREFEVEVLRPSKPKCPLCRS